MPLKLLRVYADPYGALDHEGRPAHVCPKELPTSAHDRWVGAHLHADTKLKQVDAHVLESVRAGLHEHPQDTLYDFDEAPVELPVTPYYLQRIKHGEIVAADAATAREAGVKFEDPQLVIARSRMKAIRHWRREHGAIPPFATEADARLLAQIEDAEQKAAAQPLEAAKAAAEKAASEAEAKAEAAAKAKAKAYEALCKELLGDAAPTQHQSAAPAAGEE
jgi:hypothetical protein